MKVYVLLRDGVPLGYCLAAATQGTLRNKHYAIRRGALKQPSWLHETGSADRRPAVFECAPRVVRQSFCLARLLPVPSL